MQKQQNHVNQLVALSKEYPTLRIVPMVQSEIIANNDFAWWVGGFGNACIEEMYDDGERCYIRSNDEDDLIEDVMIESDDYLFGNNEELYAKAKEIIDNYKWEKVIAVKVNLP